MRTMPEFLYTVAWSPEDLVYVARVREFRFLAAHGDTEQQALDEIKSVVADVWGDMSGEERMLFRATTGVK